jgi:hypothetical protein
MQTSLLYFSRGMLAEPEFEAPAELRIDEPWRWTGQRWGGLPDGSSCCSPTRRR